MHKSAIWILPLVFISMIAAAYIGVSLRKPVSLPFGCDKTYINAKGEDTGECE